MDRFTPGPWTCDPGEPADYSVGLDGSPPGIYAARPNAEEPDDDPILLFVPREPMYSEPVTVNLDPDDLSADYYNERYHGSMSANMTLAAAAPDLLAALESLTDAAWAATSEHATGHEIDYDLLFKCEAAIKDAGGRPMPPDCEEC